ncbi:hypothetical protein BH10BAC3_BH10BAC3_12100 [soil metagenome]
MQRINLTNELFQIFTDGDRRYKILRKKTEVVAYTPKPKDKIIKIQGDDFASIHIERKRLRRICRSIAGELVTPMAQYVLAIHDFLKANVFVDWSDCLAGAEAVKLFIPDRGEHFSRDEQEFIIAEKEAELINLIKKLLIREALIAGAIMVYDKSEEKFAGLLLVKKIRITERIKTRDKCVKLFLPNKHLVFSF